MALGIKGRPMGLEMVWGSLFFFLLTPAFSETRALSAKVSGVHEGDLLTVFHDNRAQKVRLYGVASPGPKEAMGRKAKEFSEDLIFGRVVEVEVLGEVGRAREIIGILRFNGKILNEELVRAGMARVHPELCKQEVCAHWRALEDEARAEKRGLWASSQQRPPWERKKTKR
jgi:endonuclease YncB( thermonuclease family)